MASPDRLLAFAVTERSVGALTALKLAGGLYLVYLGVKTCSKRGQLAGLGLLVSGRKD